MIDEESINDEDSTNTDSETDADDEISSLGELPRTRRIGLNSPYRTTVEVEVQTTPAEMRRECIVCTNTIGHHVRSIQPCRCGHWVHEYCLITGLQEYEAINPGYAPLVCRFCLTPYNIRPRKNPIVILFENLFFVSGPINKFGLRALTVVLVDATFCVIGMIILRTVYGADELKELLFPMSPMKAVAICKCIPIVSIFINSIPWEDKFLGYLRRWSQLPLVGRLFPMLDHRIRENMRHRSRLGVMVGGLLLPFFANMFGALLFGAVQSRIQRLFLGGGAFIILKGTLYMYYRQKLYSRQCLLNVETYNGE